MNMLLDKLLVLLFLCPILCCCGGNENLELAIGEEVSGDSEGRFWNDSAMAVVAQSQDFELALQLIDKAIESSSNNCFFVNNKGMILANGGWYEECIQLMAEREECIGEQERLSTSAIAYYHLKDSENFELFKDSAVACAEKTFGSTPTENSLVAYVTTLKLFLGEESALEVLEKNYQSVDVTLSPSSAAFLEDIQGFLSNLETLEL